MMAGGSTKTNNRKPYNGDRRALVLAFDVGTTFSGVSYAFLEPGEVPKILGVTRYPGQEHVTGNTKIPSLLYYDRTGSVVAAGAEAESGQIADMAEDEGWSKVELFKLRLRPRRMSLEMNGMRLSPLPPGKTAEDVFGDFLRYLFQCTKKFIEDTHANGKKLWRAVERDIHFVLSHPNGWEGAQQSRMRRSAIAGGLISNTDEGKARIRFVTEGEASMHACILSGLAHDVLASGNGFIVADAGGGTLDVSSYILRGTHPLQIEEVAPPDCVFSGAVFVSRRCRVFLQEKLRNSKYGTPDTLDHITKRFDETTKRLFRDKHDAQYIPFGSPLDKDLKAGIRGGQLKLTGAEVADLFEPSIQAAVDSIRKQVTLSRGAVKAVWLVGGFAASPWLFSQLQQRLAPMGVTVNRPDSQTSKAVADGAIGFFCDHHVSARMSRYMYGVEYLREIDESDAEHVTRAGRQLQLPSGPRYLPDAFDCILAKNVRVKESSVFSRKYYTEVTKLSTLSVFEIEIWCYRGGESIPKWIDRNSDTFGSLCFVRADLSRLSNSAEPKRGANGQTYWTVVFSIEIHFGLTEFKARMKWNEDGKTRYGPATIVFNEKGVRSDEDDAYSVMGDDGTVSIPPSPRKPYGSLLSHNISREPSTRGSASISSRHRSDRSEREHVHNPPAPPQINRSISAESDDTVEADSAHQHVPSVSGGGSLRGSIKGKSRAMDLGDGPALDPVPPSPSTHHAPSVHSRTPSVATAQPPPSVHVSRAPSLASSRAPSVAPAPSIHSRTPSVAHSPSLHSRSGSVAQAPSVHSRAPSISQTASHHSRAPSLSQGPVGSPVPSRVPSTAAGGAVGSPVPSRTPSANPYSSPVPSRTPSSALGRSSGLSRAPSSTSTGLGGGRVPTVTRQNSSRSGYAPSNMSRVEEDSLAGHDHGHGPAAEYYASAPPPEIEVVGPEQEETHEPPEMASIPEFVPRAPSSHHSHHSQSQSRSRSPAVIPRSISPAPAPGAVEMEKSDSWEIPTEPEAPPPVEKKASGWGWGLGWGSGGGGSNKGSNIHTPEEIPDLGGESVPLSNMGIPGGMDPEPEPFVPPPASEHLPEPEPEVQQPEAEPEPPVIVPQAVSKAASSRSAASKAGGKKGKGILKNGSASSRATAAAEAAEAQARAREAEEQEERERQLQARLDRERELAEAEARMRREEEEERARQEAEEIERARVEQEEREYQAQIQAEREEAERVAFEQQEQMRLQKEAEEAQARAEAAEQERLRVEAEEAEMRAREEAEARAREEAEAEALEAEAKRVAQAEADAKEAAEVARAQVQMQAEADAAAAAAAAASQVDEEKEKLENAVAKARDNVIKAEDELNKAEVAVSKVPKPKKGKGKKAPPPSAAMQAAERKVTEAEKALTNAKDKLEKAEEALAAYVPPAPPIPVAAPEPVAPPSPQLSHHSFCSTRSHHSNSNPPLPMKSPHLKADDLPAVGGGGIEDTQSPPPKPVFGGGDFGMKPMNMNNSGMFDFGVPSGKAQNDYGEDEDEDEEEKGGVSGGLFGGGGSRWGSSWGFGGGGGGGGGKSKSGSGWGILDNL